MTSLKIVFYSFTICEIEWSPKGSNNRIKEDETIYCWENFLKKIEGVYFIYVTIVFKSSLSSVAQLQRYIIAVPSDEEILHQNLCYFLDNEMFYQTEEKSIIVHFEHLLQFTTGSESIPPTGFENSLTITFYDQEDGQTRYPYSSTCAMSLALPRGHEDRTMFEELLLRSLFDSFSFYKI